MPSATVEAAAPGPVGTDPQDLASLTWELEAGTDVGVTTGSVTSWGDQSPTGFDLTQAAATAPTEVDGAADFNGSDDRLLSSAALSSIMTSASAWTLAVVLRVDGVDAIAGTRYHSDPVLQDTDAYVGILSYDSGGQAYLQGYVWDGGAKYTAQVAVTIGTVYHVSLRLAGGTLYLRVDDGTTQQEGSVACGNVGGRAATVRLGYGQAGFFDGVVYHTWASSAAESTTTIDSVAENLLARGYA